MTRTTTVSRTTDADVVVVGAGIVGLAAAVEVQRRRPGASVVVLDKEDGPARHQTGRNSGVVHSGLYYAPGSAKALLVAEGRSLLEQYCSDEGTALRPLRQGRRRDLGQRGRRARGAGTSRRGERCRGPSHRSTVAARPRTARARRRGAVRARHGDHRLRRGRPVARGRPGRRGRRAAHRRGGGSCDGARRSGCGRAGCGRPSAPHSLVRELRRAPQRPPGSPRRGRRRPGRGVDRAVPGGVPRAGARGPGTGAEPGVPGSRPPVAVPGGPHDPDGRRLGARRPERGARARPRGLFGRHRSRAMLRRWPRTGGCGAWRAGTGARERRSWCDRVRSTCCCATCSGCCPRSARRTWCPRAPASGPRRSPGTGPWSTTSPSPRSPRGVHVVNAPSPAATASLAIAAVVADRLDGLIRSEG